MTSRPEPINAIAYAQYHLRGGRRTLLWVFFGALVAIGGIGAITLGTSFNVREAARSAAGLLMVLQWLNLTLFTALRVGASVRQDFSSGMIESHRLTPASPVLSVLGYSVGAGVPLLTLSVAIGLAGAAFTVLADLPVTLWLVGNVMALGTGLLVWTLVTLLTVSTTNPGAVPGLGLLTLPAGGLVLLVPALGVLAAPLTGQSIWNPSGTGTGTLSPAYVLTLVADTLLAGTFTLAAARKYRSAVADAFNVRLSLLLLVIWTAVTLIGYARPDLFVTPSGGRGGTGDPTPRLIAAVISSALIALFPVIAAARASVWRPDTFAPGRTRRPAPPWLLIPLAAGLATAGGDRRAAGPARTVGTATRHLRRHAGVAGRRGLLGRPRPPPRPHRLARRHRLGAAVEPRPAARPGRRRLRPPAPRPADRLLLRPGRRVAAPVGRRPAAGRTGRDRPTGLPAAPRRRLPGPPAVRPPRRRRRRRPRLRRRIDNPADDDRMSGPRGCSSMAER